MLELRKSSTSKAFFEFDPFADLPKGVDLDSWKSRLYCFLGLLRKIAMLPFSLIYKALKTCFRVSGVFLGIVAVLITLGVAPDSRKFLLDRMVSLGTDIADWILLPFAILVCFLRLLLASVISPAIFLSA